jgi:hypothetical protein
MCEVKGYIVHTLGVRECMGTNIRVHYSKRQHQGDEAAGQCGGRGAGDRHMCARSIQGGRVRGRCPPLPPGFPCLPRLSSPHPPSATPASSSVLHPVFPSSRLPVSSPAAPSLACCKNQNAPQTSSFVPKSGRVLPPLPPPLPSLPPLPGGGGAAKESASESSTRVHASRNRVG